MKGFARNNTAAREYLEACHAVQLVTERDSDMVEFTFDPERQPKPEDIPDGVFFDVSEAPF